MNAETREGMGSSKTAHWWTPPIIYEKVIELLGGIDLDPCSNLGAPNVPADVHYTEGDDGLLRPWFGRVFINPPYGKEPPKWTAKAIAEVAAGTVEAVIMLVAARTDTDWFQPLIDYPVCWRDGRITFIDGLTGMPAAHAAYFPSAIVYLRPEYRSDDLRQFREVFGSVGKITLGAL